MFWSRPIFSLSEIPHLRALATFSSFFFRHFTISTGILSIQHAFLVFAFFMIASNSSMMVSDARSVSVCIAGFLGLFGSWYRFSLYIIPFPLSFFHRPAHYLCLVPLRLLLFSLLRFHHVLYFWMHFKSFLFLL